MLDVNILMSRDRRTKSRLRNMISSERELTDRLSYTIAQKVAKHMRREAKSVFTFPSGQLANSIRARRLGDGVHGVLASEYALYVDSGRAPGRSPPPSAKLDAWAKKAGIPPHRLASGIGRRGTRPRPFIDRGIIKARPDWKESLRAHMDYLTKSGGRTL